MHLYIIGKEGSKTIFVLGMHCQSLVIKFLKLKLKFQINQKIKSYYFTITNKKLLINNFLKFKERLIYFLNKSSEKLENIYLKLLKIKQLKISKLALLISNLIHLKINLKKLHQLIYNTEN